MVCRFTGRETRTEQVASRKEDGRYAASKVDNNSYCLVSLLLIQFTEYSFPAQFSQFNLLCYLPQERRSRHGS